MTIGQRLSLLLGALLIVAGATFSLLAFSVDLPAGVGSPSATDGGGRPTRLECGRALTSSSSEPACQRSRSNRLVIAGAVAGGGVLVAAVGVLILATRRRTL